MTVKLSPLFNDEQLDNNGLPLAGGLVYWYAAGTSTPQDIFTSIAGDTAQANPVVLNSRGEPANPIWLTVGQSYKATLRDSVGNILRTIDNISGVNDVSFVDTSGVEWILFGAGATYISPTSFSVAGDRTSIFTKYRRLTGAISAGTWYGTISIDPVYSGGITTITTVNDSLTLDSGLSAVSYALLNSVHPSVPGNVPFPFGTICIFAQAAAPTGWTQIVDDPATNRILRVVNDGSAGGVGGSADPTVGPTGVPAHTHIVSGTVDSGNAVHFHTIPNLSVGIGTGLSAGAAAGQVYGGVTDTQNAPHDHTFSTTSQTNAGASNAVFRYVNVIACRYGP